MFADIAPDAALAQEEIFGPVLAVIKRRTYEEGLEVADNTEYGLTGAIYSSDRRKVGSCGAAEFHVGNLYFNRKCTGAIVGAHPFGGFNIGTDSKAGGPDYLALFTQAKSVAEKL